MAAATLRLAGSDVAARIDTAVAGAVE